METVERLTLLGEIAGELAHELRNALQVITASTYVAESDPARAPAQLARIARAAADAQRLIDDMLDLARGERGPRERVDLRVPVAAARDHLKPGAARFVDELPDDAWFSVHPRLFARLLGTLFDNAIAVSPRPPTIVTRARFEGAHLVVEVEDDGPGVPEELAATLFDALVTGRPGGTGLGLALARRITRAHDGSLELLTLAPHGAVFRLVLPG